MNLVNITHRSPQTLDRNRVKLNEVYKRLPDTKGCMESINAEGGCGAWCCQVQNPQVLETEFANTWKYVKETLDAKQTTELIALALRNFLSNGKSKGCIFFDKSNRLCTQHETRPYACRIYGVMPDEEWKPRYERLKVLNADAREQCGLVETVDGQPFTKQQSDALWNLLVSVEASNGISRSRIHDGYGGTYRTFHDHIVTNLFNPTVITQLSKARISASEEAKERLIEEVVKRLEENGVEEHARSGSQHAVSAGSFAPLQPVERSPLPARRSDRRRPAVRIADATSRVSLPRIDLKGKA